MKNRHYEEFAKEKFDKEKNYDAIISKIKEGSPMKNKSKKHKILNIAAIFIVAIVVASLAPSIYAKIQWNIQFKEYQNREYETGSGTIKEAEESGYGQEVDMEYITQDGIGVKVDSIMITDDYFKANINFKFAEGIEVNSNTFAFGIAVYDEQKKVYGISTRMHLGTKQKYDYYTTNMYKEIGIEYNKKDVYAIQLSDEKQGGIVSVDEENRNIISRITSNDEDYLFDFKNKSYETETLKISKESLPLKIKKEDIENVKSILDVLGFEQTSNIVRTRFVFVKDEVKFEIDDYIKPKMLVVSVEGKRDKVDKVYNEVKNMFDIVN